MSDLQVSSTDGVLRLHIDREHKRNALSGEILRGMLDALACPGDARVVVVSSAGRVFCSGADLTQMAPEATGLEIHESRGLVRELVLAMQACPAPVVASVQGPCLAGGLGLVLGCDIVLAAEHAEFGLPEVDIGIWPFMVSALLATHVSPKRASEMMLSGRRVPAREALEMGIVSRITEKHVEDTNQVVAELASKPPVAVRLGKAAFRSACETPLHEALLAMQAQLSLLNTTHDASEGISAFLEKRKPSWTGR